jgi:serralysin
MFQETFAGGSGRLQMLAENAVPGGARATIAKSVIHNGGCACVACHAHDGGKSWLPFSDNTGTDTVVGGVGTTATLSPGSAVQNTIETAGDSDWFRISLVAGQSYTFTVFLPPSGLRDSILTLRDANGVQITQNDDANVNANLLYSEIRFTAATSGTYYLDVTSFGTATGNYILSSSRPVVDAAGDTTATTATLTVGGAATNASLEATGDRDWYRVTLEAGRTYEFITTSTGGANDVDTTLTLRSATGSVLAFNDDSSGTYSRIRFVAQTSGTFFLDVGGFADSEAGTYRVSVAEAAPLTEFTPDQIANQLLNGYWGGPGAARRFNVAQGGTITVNVTGLTAEGAFLAREALALWSDVLGVTFAETTGSAQITFDDNQEGAFASSTRVGNFITSASVNVGTGWLTQFGTGLNTYSFQTYVHEVGHALGLGHGGNYNNNASYVQDALYLNDSWATTIMSYFDQTENTFFAAQGFSRAFAITPMQGDVVAIQQAYGEANITRTGDTIYGVGNTSGRAIYGVDSAVRSGAGNLLAFTIVDHGGNDTLDYSVFSANQTINLNPETFSSVGGSTGNMSIARGTIIENAVGGSGNDTLTGNAVANRLTGGLGNDTLNGGSNVDTAIVRGLRSQYTVTQTATGVFRVVGPDGTDTLTAIEFLQFDDQTIRLLPGTGVSVNFNTSNPAVYQTAMNAIRDFDGNALGGNGNWLRIGQADVNGDGDIDQILVNRAIGRFATVGTAPDGLVYFSDFSWAGETRVAGIYIDPLVAAGIVEAFGPNDSQRRFQNDLQIENINRVLGADDYDNDGLQEVYLALTDGTAYLRAIMEFDGNIRYANYQSQQEVIDYLTANGFGPETWAGWFTQPSSGEAGLGAEQGLTAQDASGRGAFAAPAADILAGLSDLALSSHNPHGGLFMEQYLRAEFV